MKNDAEKIAGVQEALGCSQQEAAAIVADREAAGTPSANGTGRTPLEQANTEWRPLLHHDDDMTRILRRGEGGDAEYLIDYNNGGRLESTLAGLYDPRIFRPRAVQATGQSVERITPTALQPLADAIVKAAEPDTAEPDETRDWIESFMRQGGRYAGPWAANVEEAPVDIDDAQALWRVIQDADPASFRDKDGRPHLRLHRLRDYVSRVRGERGLTERKLAARLRRARYEPERLVARGSLNPDEDPSEKNPETVEQARYWTPEDDGDA